MKISSKGRYAVRVLVDIAKADKEYVSLNEVAERQNISLKYLEQIIARLSRSGLLVSLRGASGGYKLKKSPKDISISEILAITKDMPEFVRCQKSGDCPMIDSCSTAGVWGTLAKIIYDYLDSVSLQDLIDKTYEK